MIGEFWTRTVIWAALMLYGGSVLCYLEKEYGWAKLMWTVGCVCYLVHVVFAFHYFHDWSHQLASDATAVQTHEAVGVRTGIGIYVNYLFTAVWMLDTVYWLLVGNDRYARRNPRVTWLLHAFFLFMILNGAVVFTQGKSRLIGAVLLSVIVINFMLAGLKKMINKEDVNQEKG